MTQGSTLSAAVAMAMGEIGTVFEAQGWIVQTRQYTDGLVMHIVPTRGITRRSARVLARAVYQRWSETNPSNLAVRVSTRLENPFGRQLHTKRADV